MSDGRKDLNWVSVLKDIDHLTIEVLWRLYSKSVFSGVTVSAEQYSETKKAFYVGFSECFKAVSDVSERLPEEKAMAVLARLSNESNKFISSLIERRAGK